MMAKIRNESYIEDGSSPDKIVPLKTMTTSIPKAAALPKKKDSVSSIEDFYSEEEEQ